MVDMSWSPGPYTLSNLAREARTQAPLLLRTIPHFPAGFAGDGRVDGRTRLLVQLRMARLMGCPVCVGLFPRLAAKAGIDETAVKSALDGLPDGLSSAELAAVTWTGELVRRDGAEPVEVPPDAVALSEAQRRHLSFVVRLELVVHATGLMFLPHRWIEAAAVG